MLRTPEAKKIAKLVTDDCFIIPIQNLRLEGHIRIKRFRQYDSGDEKYEEYDLEFKGKYKVSSIYPFKTVEEFNSIFPKRKYPRFHRRFNSYIRDTAFTKIPNIMVYFSIDCNYFRTRIKKILWT